MLVAIIAVAAFHAPLLPHIRLARTQQRVACSASSDARQIEAPALPPARPSTEAIVGFALPALGLWLSAPLLSLVDTSAVGLSAPSGAGALRLASLGPATTFCDGASYLFAFLNTATTNLYASALAADDDTEAVVRRASKVALACGTAVVPLLLLFGKQMLRLYIGSAAAADPALLNPASAYVAIRCLSFPAALLAGVLQAALLGAKDSITPLISIGYATVTNVVLDLLLVAGLGWGLRGAALATLVAQWLSTIILIRQARRKLCTRGGLGLVPTRLDAWMQTRRAGPPSATAPPTTVPTGRFLVFAAPVLTLIVGKIAAFGFLTHAAAGLGALSLAAHQIALSLFFFISPFLEVISQTAQAYMPAYSAPPGNADQRAWRSAADALALRLLRYALFVSACAALFGAAVPLCGAWLLTNAPAVQLAVRPLALPLAVAALLTGPVCASEGVLLARRQLGFLAGVRASQLSNLPRMSRAI